MRLPAKPNLATSFIIRTFSIRPVCSEPFLRQSLLCLRLYQTNLDSFCAQCCRLACKPVDRSHKIKTQICILIFPRTMQPGGFSFQGPRPEVGSTKIFPIFLEFLVVA